MANSEKLELLRKKLNEVNCPYYNVSDEGLLTMLFERTDMFESFLHWALIKMDSEYEEYLKNSPDRKKEVITILNQLQITRDHEKFMVGGLSKTQQLDVWLRLFAAIEYVIRFDEDPVQDSFDIEDITFKEKKTDKLLLFHDLPNCKVLSLQEVELLLQDAEAKLKQLETAIEDQKTIEGITNYIINEDMEKIVTSLDEKLGELRESLANYKKNPTNNDLNRQQSSENKEIISVTKIKELGEKLSAGNLFLSYLNDRRFIVGTSYPKNEPEEKLDIDELCDSFF